MDQKVFNEALRAAARVACATAILGMAQVDGAVAAPQANQVVVDQDAKKPTYDVNKYAAQVLQNQGVVEPTDGEQSFYPQKFCQLAAVLGLPTGPINCTPWGPPVPPSFKMGVA